MSTAQIVSAVCNFLSLALIARLLGPAVQGQWVIYISTFTLGSIVLGVGLPPAINHFLASGKIERRFLIGQLFLFSLICAVAFVVFGFAISLFGLDQILLPDVYSVEIVLIGLGLHLFFMLFNQLLNAVLFAEKRYDISATISILGAVLILGGVAYFHYFQNETQVQSFLTLIIVNIVVLFSQSILYLVRILKIEGFFVNFRFFNKQTLMLLLGFASLAYVTNVLQFLNYKLDVWFINAFEAETDKLGIYGVAVSIAQLIWLLPNAFHSIIFTDISKEKSDEYINKIQKWAVRIFVIAAFMAIGGFILSIWLIPIIFGSEYNEVVDIFPYLLPGIVVFAPTILLSAYFSGNNQLIINFKATLIGFVACVIFNILLIPTYSIIGAAVASSISYMLSAIYLVWCFSMRPTSKK